MKTFFGGVFIEKERLEEAGIFHPIKLEYYKYTNNVDFRDKNKSRYGISIIKTEYKSNKIVEEKSIQYLTNDENRAMDILQLLKNNEVTPIGAEDVIQDYAKSIL